MQLGFGLVVAVGVVPYPKLGNKPLVAAVVVLQVEAAMVAVHHRVEAEVEQSNIRSKSVGSIAT
ncbi:hypothetical protein [Acidithiobacillus acidisediminis]|uniref:hypothetical protein n=1 Tax=Acidithiobacillus TaxID=119977 RepID=UPI002010AB9D|nr:hypothetical protein [Acidithiobacillus sp. S30A2]